MRNETDKIKYISTISKMKVITITTRKVDSLLKRPNIITKKQFNKLRGIKIFNLNLFHFI